MDDCEVGRHQGTTLGCVDRELRAHHWMPRTIAEHQQWQPRVTTISERMTNVAGNDGMAAVNAEWKVARK